METESLLTFIDRKRFLWRMRSQILFAFKRGYIIDEDLDSLTNKLIEISNQISGFQRYLRESDMRGRKFVN